MTTFHAIVFVESVAWTKNDCYQDSNQLDGFLLRRLEVLIQYDVVVRFLYLYYLRISTLTQVKLAQKLTTKRSKMSILYNLIYIDVNFGYIDTL